jgi:hypothetical protein
VSVWLYNNSAYINIPITFLSGIYRNSDALLYFGFLIAFYILPYVLRLVCKLITDTWGGCNFNSNVLDKITDFAIHIVYEDTT